MEKIKNLPQEERVINMKESLAQAALGKSPAKIAKIKNLAEDLERDNLRQLSVEIQQIDAESKEGKERLQQILDFLSDRE